MRLTCSSLSLFSATPEEAIAIVAELGFPAIDLVGIPTLPPAHVDYAGRDPATLDALDDAIARAGIEVATVVAIPTDGLEHWDAEEIDARVAWAVHACTRLGCGRLVLDAGNPPADGHIERGADIARWKAMIDHAFALTSAAGVTLTVEAPHTGTLAERFDEVQELLAAIDNPRSGSTTTRAMSPVRHEHGGQPRDRRGPAREGSAARHRRQRRVLPSRHRPGRLRRRRCRPPAARI